MVPARQDSRLEAAIRAVPDWRGHHIGITPLSTDHDDRYFMIEVDDEPFVLRLAQPLGAGHRVDAVGEVEITRAATTAGVATEVVAAMPQLGCLVTRFAPGRRLAPGDLDDDDVMVSLLGSLRALHACPPPAVQRSPFQEARDLRRAATLRGVALPAVGVRATEIVACIERAWSSAAPSTVACHGDLTPASLFFDGRQVWIVDYRWAGAGDPFEDLGSIVAHLEVGIERRESLLAMYFGTVRETHRARLALMSLVAHYLSAMRELARSEPSRGAVAEWHLTRVVDDALAEPFDGWLGAIG